MKRIMINEICKVYDGPHATPNKTEYGPIYLGIDAKWLKFMVPLFLIWTLAGCFFMLGAIAIGY